ncbi:hypothetical protein ACFU8Q_36995, partial [Streptomyces sp. NPDC057543]
MLFGHLEDRLRRKNTLVITLSLMGRATTRTGLLPRYSTIGVVAPILMSALRAAQGPAVGGEWSGPVLMTTEGVDDAVLITLTIWGVVGPNGRLSAVQQQSAAPVPEAALTKCPYQVTRTRSGTRGRYVYDAVRRRS